jgi:hypothetical protein
VTDPLPVHLSRKELHSLEVPPSFEAEGGFDVRLINHGESVHVHLHLDDPLSEIADLDAGNHYVEGGSERYVRVDVDSSKLDGDGHLGKLKVASAYGAETRWVDVRVSEPEPETDTVEVDESLAKPQPREESEETPLEGPTVPVLLLVVFAVLVAGSAVVVFQEPVIALGALAVLGGVAGALFFLLRD